MLCSAGYWLGHDKLFAAIEMTVKSKLIALIMSHVHAVYPFLCMGNSKMPKLSYYNHSRAKKVHCT